MPALARGRRDAGEGGGWRQPQAATRSAPKRRGRRVDPIRPLRATPGPSVGPSPGCFAAYTLDRARSPEWMLAPLRRSDRIRYRPSTTTSRVQPPGDHVRSALMRLAMLNTVIPSRWMQSAPAKAQFMTSVSAANGGYFTLARSVFGSATVPNEPASKPPGL